MKNNQKSRQHVIKCNCHCRKRMIPARTRAGRTWRILNKKVHQKYVRSTFSPTSSRVSSKHFSLSLQKFLIKKTKQMTQKWFCDEHRVSRTMRSEWISIDITFDLLFQFSLLLMLIQLINSARKVFEENLNVWWTCSRVEKGNIFQPRECWAFDFANFNLTIFLIICLHFSCFFFVHFLRFNWKLVKNQPL